MNKSILIVEDEFIVADDLQLTLQQAGYTVCGIADKVETARDIISKKNPSLVLLDIHLKGTLNGIELAKELKALNIAFVYLSANSNQKILEEAKATEPYGFLVKPFREKYLLVMIDIAFYRHENSMDAKWQKELSLQKQLNAVEKSADDLEQKLSSTAKVLQQFISFDMIALKFKPNNSSTYNGASFLRVGYDEYQFIGTKELSIITGLDENAINAVMVNSPVDHSALILNDADFEKSLSKNEMRQLLAKQFQFSSELIFPLIIGEDNIASIVFFRKQSNGFTNEQMNLLFHVMMPLVSVIKSLSISENKNASLKIFSSIQTAQHQFKNIVGNSSALLNVLDLVTQVAPVDTSVLILGESGTGKEKIASCIHALSSRKNKPFIKINCSALPPTLIESELFGHEKGAFTNAIDKRIGKFEQANTGTIFLDEIGEMPVEMQVKLLRVLQEKEIERVGGKETIRIDVRVIAATNRNLQAEIANGKFRLDLYYRLNVFPITLPPLRERKEDIDELANHFAKHYAEKFNKAFNEISEAMLQQLMAYDFPGNIRELENIMEQSVILNDGKSPLSLRQQLTFINNQNTSDHPPIKTIDDIKRLQRQTEIDHISSVLKKTHGRVRGKDGAAEILNEKPTTLESRLLKLGIKKEDFQ
ncbi:MAG TPA: sigma 54-interacting response regulator [Parafilimonas sp.]|nr:sigma 54-interacting response regulator [Parafilimonas sp.]